MGAFMSSLLLIALSVLLPDRFKKLLASVKMWWWLLGDLSVLKTMIGNMFLMYPNVLRSSYAGAIPSKKEFYN